LNARNTLIAAGAIVMIALASCGTARRAGKDLFIGVSSPVLIIYGGATDGYTSAKSVRKGLDGGTVVEVLSFPFTFTYHAISHLVHCVIHVIDLPLCLFYGAAELAPNGPEIQPLDYYQGTWFDKPSKSGTDAESGENLPPGYNR